MAGNLSALRSPILLLGLTLLALTSCSSARPVTETCVDMDRLAMHIHPHLSIHLDGILVNLRPDIGIVSRDCMRPIHTHDSSGTIHIESNQLRDYTLGEFFQVWGREFDNQTLLGKKGIVTMTVNGRPSQQFGQLVLQDGQVIVIDFRSDR